MRLFLHLNHLYFNVDIVSFYIKFCLVCSFSMYTQSKPLFICRLFIRKKIYFKLYKKISMDFKTYNVKGAVLLMYSTIYTMLTLK